MRTLHTTALTGLLAPLLLVSPGCEEESFREIHPEILVCATSDTPAARCNKALELGELPMDTPAPFGLVVRNAGDAALTISEISSDRALLTVSADSLHLDPGQKSTLEAELTPDALGADSATLTFVSDDAETPTLELPIRWEGLPVPVPQIELCIDGDLGEECGVDLNLDFGSVRRSQRESRTVRVHNVGTATLAISEVRTVGASSQPDELSVASSTRAGQLGPGAEAEIVLLYTPADAGADSFVLELESDDPDNAVARVTVTGSSVANLPPVADARHLPSGATSQTVEVGEEVVIDGSGSLDPEGDPLRFRWTLQAPDGSLAELDDPAAGRVRFTPDRAGSYRIELMVHDSLDQPSSLTAVVLLQARPSSALRATASWQSGGDIDLHLLRAGDALFSSTDCYFANPQPDLGTTGDVEDDPLLLADSIAAPGSEEIVLVAPAPGAYRLYAHYFDDAGAGPGVVSVRVVLNDASAPALQETRSLPASCDLWYIGEVRFPEAEFTSSGAAIEVLCP